MSPVLKTLGLIVLSIIAFFIILFIYTKLAGPIPFYVNQVTTQKSDTFNVTGEGKVSVISDEATITLGVQTEGSSAEQVQNQMNININRVVEAIKKLGIQDADIKTENYNVSPKYDFSTGQQKTTGYQANTNISVKVSDTQKANQVIDTAVANGATQVGGVNFQVGDKTKAEDQARKLAVEDAKKKAQQIAQTAGFKLGRLINYSENSGGQPPIMYARDAVSTQGAPEPDTRVQPGSNEIVINVTLSYEIE